MQALTIRLSDNHGVALQHSPAVAPEEVVAQAEGCGRITSHSTYALYNGAFMTLLFFAESEGCDACFAKLQALQKSEPGSYRGVGWIHENGEASFAKKPYVKERLVNANAKGQTNNAPTAATSGSNTFLVIYTARFSPEKRNAARQLASQYTLELFEDGKEGGRLFCCFATEDEEDACRRALNEKMGPLGRDISFADASDFALAKKGTVGQKEPSA